MIKNNWILCPICGNKTRVKIRENTILENFPPVLSEVQAGNHYQCETISYNSYQRARRKDVEPMTTY